MEQEKLDAVWQEILNELKNSLAPTAFRWLSPVTPISLTEDTLTLGAPTDAHCEWIESHYLAIMKDAVKATLGVPIKILLVKQKKEKEDEESKEDPRKKSPAAPKKKGTANPAQGNLFVTDPPSSEGEGSDIHIIAPGDNSSLNPKYTFDTFVIGSSNRFAHAAAVAVAESPGKVYNPFFMYGGVGLGKTHLMHAIGNRVLQNHPDMRVLYVSSEQFTNEIIRAIQEGRPETFRKKYRTIDVLMVDDIQFISGKVSTQEEFFNTFNALHVADKQIIISSDRPPREVQKLEDRLRSRFEGGLITDIQAPDLETRIAILKNKAMLDQVDVPNDVMVYIASRIVSNIRELEGALTRVVAFASLYGKPVTTDLVAEALKDVFANNKTKEITMEVIQEIVASHFAIKIEDLHSKKKARSIAYPRQIAMYLCRELTDTSFPAIGDFFGGRDHTTVLHAYEKISREKEENPKLSDTLHELMEGLNKV